MTVSSANRQILAEIDHPAIVAHVPHGIDVDMPYLAMRWVPGKSLSEYLSGAATLDVETTLALVQRVAEALAIVHGRGIVHRDIKPSNIVLDRGEPTRPVLLDFGIAHVAGAMQELTHTGELLGTPGYLAPEQVQGGEVDASTDIFALGCVVFRCLTGRSPFEAKDPLSAAVKVLLEDAPRLRERLPAVPRELDHLVARMLAREPKARPRDSDELVTLLAGPQDRPTAEDRTVRRSSTSPTGPAAPGSGRTLGGAERRVISLVIARRQDWEPELSAIEAVREVLDERLEPLRMRATVLADGSIVAAAHGDAPHDAVLRAASAGLVIASELDDARVALATGRAVMEEDVPVGETVDRAIALLERETEGIAVDPTSAALLASRFAIDERHEDAKRWKAYVLEATGHLDEALALQETAYAEIDTLAYRGAAKAGAASILLAQGKIQEARRRATEAAAELTFAPSQCAHALALVARAAVRADNLDEALEAARARGWNRRRLRLHRERRGARLRRARGGPRSARRSLRGAARDRQGRQVRVRAGGEDLGRDLASFVHRARRRERVARSTSRTRFGDPR